MLENPEPFLSRKEAAHFLSQRSYPISAKTLANLVGKGGPPFRVWGDVAQYRPVDLESWALERGQWKK